MTELQIRGASSHRYKALCCRRPPQRFCGRHLLILLFTACCRCPPPPLPSRRSFVLLLSMRVVLLPWLLLFLLLLLRYFFLRYEWCSGCKVVLHSRLNLALTQVSMLQRRNGTHLCGQAFRLISKSLVQVPLQTHRQRPQHKQGWQRRGTVRTRLRPGTTAAPTLLTSTHTRQWGTATTAAATASSESRDLQTRVASQGILAADNACNKDSDTQHVSH